MHGLEITSHYLSIFTPPPPRGSILITGRRDPLLHESAYTNVFVDNLKYDTQCRLAAISASALSPFARSFSLLYKSSSRVSVEYSWFWARKEKKTHG